MSKTMKIIIAVAAVIVLCCVAALIIMRNARSARQAEQFAQAEADLESGRYAEALEAFETLGREKYEGAEEKYAEAKEKRIAELKAADDWDGVLELDRSRETETGKAASMARSGLVYEALEYTRGTESGRHGSKEAEETEETEDAVIAAAGTWAVKMAREGRMEEVRKYLQLDSLKYGDDRYQYKYRLARSLAQALGEAGCWAEAEEMYYICAGETAWSMGEVLDDIAGCVRGQYTDAAAAGDADVAARAMEKAIALYTEYSSEPELLREVLLAPVRADLEKGDPAGAARKIRELREHETLQHRPALIGALDALQEEIVTAGVKAKDWDLLTGESMSRAFTDYARERAPEDAFLRRAYYLMTTGRGALVGDEGADVGTLIGALPAGFAVSSERLFGDLCVSAGDPAEQYAAARALAREHGIEHDFLSEGMDLSAAAAAGETLTYALPAEIIPLLPAAQQQPGGAAARDEYAFYHYLEETGAIPSGPHTLTQFVPKEPRPCYCAVVTGHGIRKNPFDPEDSPNAMLAKARMVMEALSEAGGGKYTYRLAENPETAEFLVFLDNEYKNAGKFYPPTAVQYAEDAMTAYTEVLQYDVYDLRTGKRVASDAVAAQVPDRVITGNTRDRSFWIDIGRKDIADSGCTVSGAGALLEAADAAAAALCAR